MNNHASQNPAFGLPYLVDCGSYRCQGYLDAEAHWRDRNGNLLPRVLSIVEPLFSGAEAIRKAAHSNPEKIVKIRIVLRSTQEPGKR